MFDAELVQSSGLFGELKLKPKLPTTLTKELVEIIPDVVAGIIPLGP